jgi:hemolysin activation/secretion protein
MAQEPKAGELSGIQPSSPVASKAPTFNIFEYEIEGNTVLPIEVVERVVSPFMGPGKTLADVEAARAALEKVYQDSGYITVFVDLPNQRVDEEGLVRLVVLEGKVGRLRVTGSRYYDQGYIRNRVPELAPGNVPNFSVAQLQLAELSRTDDRRVQPVLKPGPMPGTADVELKVSDQLPVHVTVELNNRQVQFTKPLRLEVTATYNNLFQEDHSLGLTFITSPQNPSESKVLGLSYMIPKPGGDAWMASLVVSDSAVQPLGSTNVVGKGFMAAIKHAWALPSSPSLNHTLRLGATYKDTKERINAREDGSDLSSPLRYLPLDLGYSATLQQGEHTTTFDINAVFAMRGVLRRDVACFGQSDQFACKREDGDGSFAALKFDIVHTHPWSSFLTGRWRVGGQLANQPLVGAEQLAIGGVDTVRGYMEAEALGDAGAYSGVEVSGPNWGHGAEGSWRASFSELQAYGFAEAGLVRVINPGAEEAQRNLAGVGMGLRIKRGKGLSANVDLAWPLKKTDASPDSAPRLHTRVRVEF